MEYRTSGMAGSDNTGNITRSCSGLRLRLLRGVAQSAFPLGLVDQVSLRVNQRKAVVCVVQVIVVVSSFG